MSGSQGQMSAGPSSWSSKRQTVPSLPWSPPVCRQWAGPWGWGPAPNPSPGIADSVGLLSLGVPWQERRDETFIYKNAFLLEKGSTLAERGTRNARQLYTVSSAAPRRDGSCGLPSFLCHGRSYFFPKHSVGHPREGLPAHTQATSWGKLCFLNQYLLYRWGEYKFMNLKNVKT